MDENVLLTLREKTILFAEDDEIVREKTKQMLVVLFKRVLVADNGKRAFELYEDERPDIVLTDVKMPLLDGLGLAAKIRQNDQNTPIILFSAHSEQRFLLQAVNLPVDGYILKPASLDEIFDVFARCIRRMPNSDASLVSLGNDIMYSRATRELYSNGEKIVLGSKEEAVLRLLVQNHPATTTKELISDKVWPMIQIGDTTIKNVVARLKAKVGQECIVTVSGIGWRLEI